MANTEFLLFLAALTAFVALGNTQSLTWSRIETTNDTAPPARRYSTMAWSPDGTALYVFGGEGSSGALGESAQGERCWHLNTVSNHCLV